MPPFKVRDAPNGRFEPGTRPPAGKTCRLYKMHDWLQPWSVITYEVGWHPNLTIGGHTVLTFGCLLDVSCKNARRFYKNSSPGHTNTVYKMGPQLVYDSSWQQVSPVVRPDPARNQQKSRCVGLEPSDICLLLCGSKFRSMNPQTTHQRQTFFSHILEHFE